MDAAYYGVTGVLKYKAGIAMGGFAINAELELDLLEHMLYLILEVELMMEGNGSKNKSLNNTCLIIHKMPLFDRIIGLFSSVILTIIPIVCLFLNYENKFNMIILLIALLFFCFVMYLSAFKTYICFDVDNNKITINKGLKKQEFSTFGLLSITVETDTKYPNLFSLNYNFIECSKKDYGWSTGPSSRVLFGTIRTQRRRLEKFCEECNRYLDK